MLRIEKLFLQGFKSFNDPTEIVFDEEGITAVVGPNGCGKSNVADAISWVIGEQRAKALRGGKMEDVIFQGSRNRQSAGMAEVTLTMLVNQTFELRGDFNPQESTTEQTPEQPVEVENVAQPETAGPESESPEIEAASAQIELEPEVEQAQPDAEDAKEQNRQRRRVATKDAPRIFHAGERISVGRRLYRTGESEYEMNGRICRLRDIQDLFAGTGLGGAHYAIIEQGRIGQVLSAKPLDRRALIEEAAGISKFKMRQHTAELKLEASRQNLSRVTDILTEIERQQNSLKRQAARARRYQRLRQEMRDLMRAVYVVDYRGMRQAIAGLETALAEISSREAQLTAAVVRLESEQSEATRVARSADEVLNQTRRLAAGIDLETERARQQHTYLNEQLQSLGSRSQQHARDQAAITERRHFIEQETFRLREELQKLEQEINNESRTLAEAEDQHRTQLDRDAESEQRLEEARKRVYQQVTHLERWRQLNRQFTDSVDRIRTRLQGLSTERERAGAQAQSALEQHASLAGNLEETSDQHRRIGDELSQTGSRLAELRQLREERQHSVSNLQRDLTATEHRLKSLNELDQRRAYFSEAVQALVKRDPQANGFKMLGTLADFVHVSPEHEAMIELALRDELQYVVVPTFDDALGAIDFLKREGAGRATFLVVGLHGSGSAGSSTNGDGHSPQRHTLGSLLGLRPEFADAFTLALPALATAKIVEDTGEAISLSISGRGSLNRASNNGAGQTLMTLSPTGERVVAGRLISGGSRSEKSIGVLALKREIADLTEQFDALSIAFQTTEGGLGEVKAQIAELEELHHRLDEELRQVDKRLAILREQLQQCERERERAATHTRVIEQETGQAEEELVQSQAKLEHAAAQTAEAEAARSEAEMVVEKAQAEMAELRLRAEERSQDLSRRRAEFAARTERRRGLQNDIRRLENEASDLDGRLSRLRLESIETDDQAAAAVTTIQNTAEQLQQLMAQQQSHTSELEAQTAALVAARDQVEALDAELRKTRELVAGSRDARANKEIEKARLTSDLEHLIHACYTELGENIVEVCQRLEKSRQAQPPEMQSEELAFPRFIEEPASERESLDQELEPLDEDSLEIDDSALISFWDVPENFDLAAAKARLDELRAKIDSLGPVNMMALEELTEVEERFTFLSAQKADIEKAITDTQAAIAEIKRRSRERFHEAFHAINQNFKQMFVELFGGGQGEMRLIDETDILESGIEIIAQPPGKRLQNVLLLSGGEKAMAAMSLVLAIFKYRPSPFCLLDEVDAPLDEVNIGRFAEKVVELSRNTQFMIITHNKRTMESARTLYGVTMEDPGVSKLISVKLT